MGTSSTSISRRVRINIEISAPGYDALTVDVVILPHHKIEYRDKLTRSNP